MANHSIANVLGFLIVTSLLISGCSSMPQKIEVSAKPVEKPKLVLPSADELNLREIEWLIITPDNWEEQLAKLKSSGRSIAFFAITDKGYQDLGLNFSDLRAYVQQQDAIIAAYQGYYKASEDALDDANGQIESAKDQVEEQQPEDERTLWEKLRGN